MPVVESAAAVEPEQPQLQHVAETVSTVETVETAPVVETSHDVETLSVEQTAEAEPLAQTLPEQETVSATNTQETVPSQPAEDESHPVTETVQAIEHAPQEALPAVSEAVAPTAEQQTEISASPVISAPVSVPAVNQPQIASAEPTVPAVEAAPPVAVAEVEPASHQTVTEAVVSAEVEVAPLKGHQHASAPMTRAPAPAYQPEAARHSDWVREPYGFNGKGAAGGNSATQVASAPATRPTPVE